MAKSSPARTGQKTLMPPRSNHPGLKWRRTTSGRQPYWVAKQVVRDPKGFPERAIRLPAAADEDTLGELCRDHTARLLAWRAAALADAHVPHTLESSVAKLYASEVAVRAANNAVQVFGGYGYIDEYPVGKFLRDARVTTLYEGTSQVQKLIIGRELTGENAFT